MTLLALATAIPCVCIQAHRYASQAAPLLSVLRVLLFGAPADNNMADALTQAALDVCQALPGQNSASSSAPAAAACPDSLQALLRVVMWGAASLTHAELADAASQILQLAGQPMDDVMVAELSQHIRQGHKALMQQSLCLKIVVIVGNTTLVKVDCSNYCCVMAV